MVTNRVSDTTVDELRSHIQEAVRETLAERISDPDEGLILQEEVAKALRQSIKVLHKGGTTHDAEDVAKKLGLER